MESILNQKTMPWGNEKIGTSKYYIWAKGSVITLLAEIFKTTPTDVNEKLTAINGFSADKMGEPDQVIWEKIVAAFPGWSAQFITPYNNETVLDALSKGQSIIVFVDAAPIDNPGEIHAVRYIGNGLCHDPWDGIEKTTLTYPTVHSFVVLTQMSQEPAPVEEVIQPEIILPTPPEAPTIEPPLSVDKINTVVTMANLPLHEKRAIVKHVKKALKEIEKLLAL